jgi:hypothetical protein
MSTNPTRPLLSILLVCCCTGLSGLAAAEPTTVPVATERATAEAAAPGRDELLPKSPAIAGDAAVNVPSPSNAIQMLLEMQATPEPAASESETGRRASVRPKAPTVAAPNPFGNGENPFGGAPGSARAAASPASAPMAIDWQTGLGGATLGGGPSPGPGLGVGGSGGRPPDLFSAPAPRGSSRDDGADQRWWMPMALIRWVREHRQAVLIGAAVALGLAWAGTSYSQRRR